MRIFIVAILLITLTSCNKNKIEKPVEVEFTNPILAGWHPDPSICIADGAYYLVNSTFSYFPGIPIFKSTNLVDWEQIGYVLNRKSQLNLEGLNVSEGLFAPAISYNDGIFYVTCTLVGGKGNFVVTAKDPAGPWSEPIWLEEVIGIDPSLFFDDNGMAYLIYNSDAPDNKPLYDGHRTLRIFEFDYKNLKVVGDNKILVNGGVRFEEKPIWIEGPHIYKINGKYFLMAAEGGTSIQHSEVILNSENPMGPYTPFDGNPIFTQRHLPNNRANPVTCVGHADLVQNFDGSWWAIFLGCRPYPPVEEGHYNNGRETFFAPVRWIDGWPIINPDYDMVQYKYSIMVKDRPADKINYSGNYTFKENFDASKLKFDWMYLRTPKENWLKIDATKNSIKMKVRPETVRGKSNPSFIGYRQKHLKGSAKTSFSFQPEKSNEKAGLLIFNNDTHYYFICKSLREGKPVIELWKSNSKRGEDQKDVLINSEEIPEKYSEETVFFKIDANNATYSFSYSFDNEKWKVLQNDVDAKYLSTNTSWGFVGCMYSLYTTSMGEESNNYAEFNYFESTNDDEIYKK